MKIKDKYDMSQWGEVDKAFWAVFGIGFQRFRDAAQSVYFKKQVVDMFGFDDWLHQCFGDYENNESKSMRDIISEHFGEDGLRLFKAVM